MDALKAQFERITQQLSALTATQKMLVAALVAVMVLTMLYWGRYAGNSEMVSVLGEQTLTDDDIGPIVHQLESTGTEYKLESGKVMVPAERKSEILASLMFARALPSDTHSAFETMSKSLNPFTGNTEREAAYSEATAMELSELISQFPGVANARVIINAKNVTRIEGGIPPSATVIVNTRGELENPKQLVRACADGVAHAVSGLTPSQISVIINGASIKVPDSDSSGLSESGDLMDLRKASEARLEQKIRDEFRFIDGLTVSVNCDVENREMKESTDEYDKTKSMSQPKSVNEMTQETTSSSAVSHEPGASANTGANGSVSLDQTQGGALAPSNTSNTSKTETINENFPALTHKDIHTPAGKDSVLSATVRVPLSYFLASYKLTYPKAGDPSDDVIATYRTGELTKIRDGVKNVIGLKSETDLSVDTYADMPAELAMATGPSAPAATLNTVTGHAREIGVAVLAVVSLLMMATMVRKSTPAPLVIPNFGGGAVAGGGSQIPVAKSSPLTTLGTGESVAGEVGGGSGALDGMEMDEDAVRTQQMLDQVSTMVKENPDGAAALVKRWLSRP
jgi:flagellar biosynthesis/type III secretory pathway M-ring protein FliF/YscJ